MCSAVHKTSVFKLKMGRNHTPSNVRNNVNYPVHVYYFLAFELEQEILAYVGSINRFCSLL